MSFLFLLAKSDYALAVSCMFVRLFVRFLFPFEFVLVRCAVRLRRSGGSISPMGLLFKLEIFCLKVLFFFFFPGSNKIFSSFLRRTTVLIIYPFEGFLYCSILLFFHS